MGRALALARGRRHASLGGEDGWHGDVTSVEDSGWFKGGGCADGGVAGGCVASGPPPKIACPSKIACPLAVSLHNRNPAADLLWTRG